MGMKNYPVLYVPVSAYESMKTDTDPDKTFVDQVGLSVSPIQWYGYPGILQKKAEQQIRIVVLNRLDQAIESTEVTAVHGDQKGQPFVDNGSGGTTPKPSSDPAIAGPAANVGDLTVDWIDAPAPGMASVGVWYFDQAFFFIVPVYGVTGVIKLKIGLTGPNLMLVDIVGPIGDSPSFYGQIFDASAKLPAAEDFRDTCEAQTGVQDVITGNGLTVKLRLFYTNLYVFVEPKK